MRTRHLAYLLLALLIAFAITGCGKKQSAPPQPTGFAPANDLERVQQESERLSNRTPPVASEPAAEPSEESGATVYLTRTGECYHAGSCSSLSRSKIPVSLAEAKERGYRPCSRCDPGE